MKTILAPLILPEKIYAHPVRYFILCFFFMTGVMYCLAEAMRSIGAPLDVPAERYLIFSALMAGFQFVSSYYHAKRLAQQQSSIPNGPL
jgi:hypothetical protein